MMDKFDKSLAPLLLFRLVYIDLPAYSGAISYHNATKFIIIQNLFHQNVSKSETLWYKDNIAHNLKIKTWDLYKTLTHTYSYFV